MKKISLLLAGGLLVTNFAAPVWAEGYGPRGMGKMEKVAMVKTKQQCLARHRMYGTIKEIDHAKGTLTMDNNEAELRLHFPPNDIKDLRVGSTITAEMGYYKGAIEE